MADEVLKYVLSLNKGMSSRVKFDARLKYIELGGTVPLTGYAASISSIEYDKRMFRPGTIDITLSVTDATKASKPLHPAVRAAFFDKLTFLDLVGFADGRSKMNGTANDLVYVARDYYFQGYTIRTVSAGTFTVTLKCFSFDKKLTLTEYCKVYTGKCLATEICKGAIESQLAGIKATLQNIDAQFIPPENTATTFSFTSTREHNPKLLTGNDVLYDINVANLLMLGCEVSKSGSAVSSAKRTLESNDTELKHPYLVQYNESFFDFAVRTAHRCGEFVYFENGRITLGLPKTTRKIIMDATVTTNDNGVSVQNYPALDSTNKIKTYTPLCDYSSDFSLETNGTSAFTTRAFVNNYIDGSSCCAVGDDNILNPSGTAAGEIYDAGALRDESLHITTEDDNRIKKPIGHWIFNKFLASYFFSESFLMGIGMAAGHAVWDLINTGAVIPWSAGKNFKKKYLDGGKNVGPANDLGKTGRVDAIGSDEIANLCSFHYRLVESLERSEKANLVTANFESSLPDTFLGDTINLSNLDKDGKKPCVVISMHGKCTTTEKASHIVEAVPIFFLKQKIGGLNAVAVPVEGEVKHSREVADLEAVVTDIDDPLAVGRVRVRFPWQDDDTSDKSPWLRVKVPFAGDKDSKNSGFFLTPTVGEHVLLGFMNNDIEQPYVCGSFYFRTTDGKGDHLPSRVGKRDETRLCKPEHAIRTIASGKGHALVFKDLENTTLFGQAIPILRTMTQFVNIGKYFSTGQLQEDVTAFGTIKGGSVTLRDGTGITSMELNPNLRQISICSNIGDIVLNAFTGITINAPNGDVTIKGKNISLEAGNNISIVSGKNLKEPMDMGKTIGGVVGKIGGMAITGGFKALTGVDLSNMFDVSFLRAVLETFLRPVEGTLQIRSKRNLIMTAGGGETTLTSSMLSRASTYGKTSVDGARGLNAFSSLATSKADDTSVEEKHYVFVKDFIQECVNAADLFYDEFAENGIQLMAVLSGLQNSLQSGGQAADRIKAAVKNDYATVNDIFAKVETEAQPLEKLDFYEGYGEGLEEDLKHDLDVFYDNGYKDKFLRAKQVYSNLFSNGGGSKFTYAKLVERIKQIYQQGLYPDDVYPYRQTCCDAVSAEHECVKGDLLKDDNRQEIKSYMPGNGTVLDEEFKRQVAIEKKYVIKYIVIKTLLAFDKVRIKNPGNELSWKQLNPGGFLEVFDSQMVKFVKGETPWEKFVPLIVKNTEGAKNWGSAKTFLGAAWDAASAALGSPILASDGKWDILPSVQKLVNLDGVSGPRSFSDPGGNGELLISSDPGYYLKLDCKSNSWNIKHNPNPNVIKRYLSTIDAPESYF